MNKLEIQEFQEYSEVHLFNEIGDMVENLGYTPVYFKVLHPKMLKNKNGFEIINKYMHYIHLYKNEEMKVSIYYDKYNLGSILPEEPYFELYDRCDIERFLDTEEDINNLLNRLNELI